MLHAISGTTMPTLEHRRIGDLDCQVVSPDKTPTHVAIFCHGFGAGGDDLVPVAEELIHQQPEIADHYQIIFPEAPLSLREIGMPNGRAWWMLDMERMQRAIEQGTIRDQRNVSPPELPAVRQQLTQLINTVCDDLGLTPSRFILGGFSQGSMVVTDVALHLEEKPAGLVIWSGTLLNEEIWQAKAITLAGVPILQSHGTTDPILPFEAATWLRDLLKRADANLEFIEFQGPHTIPGEAISKTAQLMVDQLKP